MANKFLVTLVVITLTSAAAWSQPSAEEAVQFYQALKKVPGDMEAAALVFGEKVQAAMRGGGEAEVDQMKVALVDVLLMLHCVKAETKSLKPYPSAAGKGLLEAVENYLRQQEKTIVESGPAYMVVATDISASADEKKAKLAAIIEANRKGATAAAEGLRRALIAFAREHDLAGEPTLELREFIPPDKSFRVSMPDLTENRSTFTDGVKNTYYLTEHKYGVLMLSRAEIATSDESEATVQRRLAEARAGVINKLSLNVTKESAIVLGNKHPGLEIEGTLADKSVTRIRLVLANGHLYQVWVIGTTGWAHSAEATRFFMSLEVPAPAK